MSWTISHLPSGQDQRPGGAIANLAQQLAHVLTARQWRELEAVFARRSGDPFAIPPQQAGRIAAILDQAAAHRLMGADWAGLALTLAAAARRASSSGQAWRWS